MTVLVLALTTVNQNETEALVAYLGVTGPLLEKAGARIIQRYEVVETVIGEPTAKYVTLVEYPNREAVISLFESTEYSTIKAIRERAFDHYEIRIIQE